MVDLAIGQFSQNPIRRLNYIESNNPILEMSDKDITLIVDGVPFQYNKELLIRSSQYFSAMFSDHFAEKDKSVVHIQVKYSVSSFFLNPINKALVN